MKIRFSLLLLFLVADVFTTYAQDCNTDLGTKTLYIAPAIANVKIPAGYSPVFVNYVGRHGARHLTKSPQGAYIYKLLLSADSANALTEKGKELKKMALALDKVEKGNTKNISIEGAEELAGIAARLYKNSPAIFANQPKVTVTVTKEIRTSQSAEAFLKGLKPLLKDETIIDKGINDTTLRFYDISPAYLKFEKEGSWIKAVGDLKQYLNTAEAYKKITSGFFTTEFLKTLTAKNENDFTNDLFGFATIVYSLKQEIKQAGFEEKDLNFMGFLTCAEITTLSKVDVAEDFFVKGPGADINGIQAKIAAPLLVDFIKTTDEYIADKKISAQLRFSHAETISPFATLLNLNPANKSGTYKQILNKSWEAGKVIPLSANVQWILYKNKAGKYLMRCLLNEKDAAIAGLKPVSPNFYAWADVKAYYIKKLKTVGTSLSANMLEYLRTTKQ